MLLKISWFTALRCAMNLSWYLKDDKKPPGGFNRLRRNEGPVRVLKTAPLNGVGKEIQVGSTFGMT
jgi:hypothetical protein